MNAQFKKGIIELCIMTLLVEEDLYGYKIISDLSVHINVSENTVYPIMRRLTKEAYFESYLVQSTEGAPRKYYRMTEKGFVHYLRLRDEWDAFIGGVYAIIHKGGKEDEAIFRRFKNRIKETSSDSE